MCVWRKSVLPADVRRTAPATSTLNADPGVTVANGFDIALGTYGHVGLEWAGTVGSTANLALDVTEYWR